MHSKGSARLALLTVAAIALAACGGGNATKAPSGNGGGANATQAGNGNGGGGGGDVSLAASKLSSIDSYQFRMEMAGGSWGDTLSAFGGGEGGSFVVTGTVVTKPSKAASMDFGGMKFVEVNGKSYTNAFGTWAEDKEGGSSIADSMSPQKMFGSYSSYGWTSAGDGTKNGVAAKHFTVDASVMKTYASVLGVKGDVQWTVELWIAKDGGYPVNMTMTAKQGSDYSFKFIMDITNVNDPSNKVEAPSI